MPENTSPTWAMVRTNWPIIVAIAAIIATNVRAELTIEQHGKQIDSLAKRDHAMQELQREFAVLNEQRKHDKEKIDDMHEAQKQMLRLLMERLPPSR